MPQTTIKGVEPTGQTCPNPIYTDGTMSICGGSIKKYGGKVADLICVECGRKWDDGRRWKSRSQDRDDQDRDPEN